MRDFFHHFFIPRESNNYRAKLLHHQSIFFVIAALFIIQVFFSFGKSQFSSNVLGTSINLSSQELLLVTNQKRQAEGLSALSLNTHLSDAALLKAQDMFAKNYWSHNGPDGTTPWVFIKKTGYEYIYAGENLARGFTTSSDVVDAWMASPTHRENMLSPNYQEVGYAIEEGKLLGENTTLIVEMFGSTTIPADRKNTNSAKENSNSYEKQANVLQAEVSVKNAPVIDTAFISSNIVVIVLGLFIFILILDMIVVKRKNIGRLVGHNLDHILFLGALLIIVLLFETGVIL